MNRSLMNKYSYHLLQSNKNEYIGIFLKIITIRKYKALHDKMVAKFHRCTKIVLGKCGSKDAAFLIQNAFPITEDYLDHIHTLQGNPLTLHATTAKTVVDCLNNNLMLNKRGVKLFFADIDRLFQLMVNHFNAQNADDNSSNVSDSTDQTTTSPKADEKR